MANKYKENRVINGTFGRVWVNDEDRANIKSFEAKLNLNYEDINIAEELGTQRKYMGYSGEGTATFNKFDSYFIKLLAEGIRTGNMPEVNIVGKLADPAAYGAERIKLYDVTFDEAMLMKFESKTITEESMPFKFGSFELLSLID